MGIPECAHTEHTEHKEKNATLAGYSRSPSQILVSEERERECESDERDSIVVLLCG